MKKARVFLSYSHADEVWKDRLTPHLFVLQHEDLLDVWDDRRLAAGEDWLAGIEDALNNADAAILLISADFLISDFIRCVEVPRLLRRRQNEGMPVLPVLVKDCLWEHVDWLEKMTIRPTDARPVSSFNGHKRDAALKTIAREVLAIVESTAKRSELKSEATRKPPRSIVPTPSADELFLAVHGGNTNSIALASTANEIVAMSMGGSINLHYYSGNAVSERVTDLIDSVARSTGFNEPSEFIRRCSHVALSSPGLTTLSDKSETLAVIRNTGLDRATYTTIDDTWAGLVGGGLTKHAICAFAGSNTAVYVGTGEFVAGRPFKLDGWGPVVGDYGSAYDLATQTMRVLTREMDAGNRSPLFEDILKVHPELVRIESLQNWFDDLQNMHGKAWRTQFARIGFAIVEAANRPNADPKAVELVRAAAVDLAGTIKLALASPERGTLPIICQGSMFKHSKLYFDTVRSTIAADHPNRIALAAYGPVVGALLLSVGGGAELPSEAIAARLLKSIFRFAPQQLARLVVNATSDDIFGGWTPEFGG